MISAGLKASAAAIAVMLGAWIWAAFALPQDATQVPVHWGVSGKPDDFVAREHALAYFGALPGTGLLLTLLFWAIPRLEPLRDNLLKGSRAYLAAWIGVQAILALVSLGMAFAWTAPDGASPAADAFANVAFARLVIAATGVLFVFIGDALPKTRPNFFLGVRTPWTLSSDLSWERTHRFAGRSMVVAGLWMIIAPFFLEGETLAFAIAAPFLAVVLAAIVYSYIVWRSDPNRRKSILDA
jgi:uncharacterized membrane protein